MRENLIQTGQISDDGRAFIEDDWYAGGIPPNVRLSENVYLDTSYGFAAFHSELESGFELGAASGAYDRASFVVGQNGQVKIGSYTVLNGSTIICNDLVTVGDHCLIAWGAVITDSWTGFTKANTEKRREILRFAAKDEKRRLLPLGKPLPIVIEDNVWVGFDSVILPGVRLGRGSIIGCKTVVAEDVPPYAIVVGNPARIVRYMEADDTKDARQKAFRELIKMPDNVSAPA